MKIKIWTLSFLFIAGCATVEKQPEAVEAPVSREAQLAAQQQAAQPQAPRLKRKVGIGRFSNETRYGRSLLRDGDNDPLGKQISDILAGRLVESGRFLVFERPDISKIKAESAYSDQALELVGIDTIILGSLVEFGHNTTGKKGFMSATKKQTAKATVELRLVDVKTGRVYFSARGSGSASLEAGEIAGYGSKAAYDATLNDQALSAAVGDVLNQVIQKLEEKPWQTDILKVDGSKVFISGGSRQGISKGDLFVVKKRGEKVKSQQTGTTMELPAQPIAKIRILSFFGTDEMNEGSVAEIVEGSLKGEDLKTLFVTEEGEE